MSSNPKPKPKPGRTLRERGCTSKVRYISAPEAELAALTRMLEGASNPLAVYECLYCTGYHLTSSQVVSSTSVEIVEPVMRTNVTVALRRQIARDSFSARRKKWQRDERIRRVQKRRRDRDTKDFFEENPPPRVASSQEVAAFFSRYGRVA